MKTKPRPRSRHESAIDELATAQAHDERAWTAPIRVRSERDLDSWVRRVVQERLDWEQAALAVVKRRLGRKPS